MAYRKRKYSRKARKGPRKIFAKAKKAAFASKVKPVVARMLAPMIEVKQAQWQGPTSTFGDTGGNTDIRVIPLTPWQGFLDVDQGVGQGGRIGNEVRLKKLQLNMILNPARYDSISNPNPAPQMIRSVIFRDKTIGTETIPTPYANGDFFQNGGTSVGFTGGLPDIMREINKDRYQVFSDRQYKLGFAEYAGTGGAVGVMYSANNDYKMNYIIKMDITKYAHKNIDWRDTFDQPVTPGLFLVMFSSQAYGQVNTGLVSWGATRYLSMEYTDF